MNKNSTPLVDEHLGSLLGMKEAGTDDFFYTRVKGRMQDNEPGRGWNLPLKPVWVISTLVVLLTVNAFMLLQQGKTKTTSAPDPPSLQSFAESYDQTIVSSY